jgi:fructokinase
MIVNVFDPDTVVFGGGLSNVDELYAQLPSRMRPRIFSDAWDARLVPARWGDSSGVRGAARLW